MAALSASQYPVVWSDGQSDRAVLYALKLITAGDTVDVSGQFLSVKRGVMLGTTINGAVAATVTNDTTITIPAGPSKDAGYLLVWGVSV